MSLNLPNWFTKKYDDTVLHRAQQSKRLLADKVSGGGTFIGNSVYFPRIGAVEAYDSPRMAALALANADQDMIEVKAKPKFIALGVWDPDKNKLGVNAAAEYGTAAVKGIFRAEDAMIRDQLNDAAVNGVTTVDNNGSGTTNEAITTLSDYNTVLDLDILATAIATLGAQYEFEGEDICLVTPFKEKVNMSLDPYMAKSDMKNNLPWNDVTFVSYEKLYDSTSAIMTAASVGVDCFLFARSAVASGYNDEMKAIHERLGLQLTDMLGQWFQAGACVKEPKGVIRIKSKHDFALARHPIPTHAV